MEAFQGGGQFHTAGKAKGIYTGNEIKVIDGVVTRSKIRKLQRLVKAHDPSAFLAEHDVREVWGKGFRHMNDVNKKRRLSTC